MSCSAGCVRASPRGVAARRIGLASASSCGARWDERGGPAVCRESPDGFERQRIADRDRGAEARDAQLLLELPKHHDPAKRGPDRSWLSHGKTRTDDCFSFDIICIAHSIMTRVLSYMYVR